MLAPHPKFMEIKFEGGAQISALMSLTGNSVLFKSLKITVMQTKIEIIVHRGHIATQQILQVRKNHLFAV